MNLDTQLAQLEDMQLIRPVAEQDRTYFFKHMLTQESTYASLLLKRRREIHRRVARTYEQFYPQHLDEYAALLAHHYAAAGDDDKTLDYSERAGDVAARVYAYAEASEYYSRALEIANRAGLFDDPRQPARVERLKQLFLKRGRTYETNGQFEAALRNYEEMQQLGQAHGHPRLELASYVARATVYSTPTTVFNVAQGQQLSERALEMARELGDREAQARILWNLLLVHRAKGQPQQVVEFGEQALALARSLNLNELVAYILNDLGTYGYSPLGQQALARTALDEAIARWREFKNIPMLVDTLVNSASFYMLTGQMTQAKAQVEEAYEQSRTIGNLWGQGFAGIGMGWLELEQGHYDRACRILEEAVALGDQGGLAATQSVTMYFVALMYTVTGAFDQAKQRAEQAAGHALAMVPGFQSAPIALRGYLHALQGNLEEAEADIAKARLSMRLQGLSFSIQPLVMAEAAVKLSRQDYGQLVQKMDEYYDLTLRVGQRINLPDILFFKGRGFLALDQLDQAEAAFENAKNEAQALNSRRTLWPILLASSQVQARRGNQASADALRLEARREVEYILDHTHKPELRTPFLNLAEVRTVLASAG